MAGMLEYKCPCCDGAIKFDSTTQKMKCPYCDTEFDVDTLKGYDEELKDEKPSEMNWATPGGSWAEGETAGLHTYVCKSCGGFERARPYCGTRSKCLDLIWRSQAPLAEHSGAAA